MFSLQLSEGFNNFYTGWPQVQALPSAARDVYRQAQSLGVFPSIIKRCRRYYDDVHICEVILYALDKPRINNRGAYIVTMLKRLLASVEG